MTSYLDRLNLRPNERRLVVFVAVVVFVVLNLWLVWPHFGDWRQTQGRMRRAQNTLTNFQAVVRQLPDYRSRVQSLEKESPAVAKDDQSIELARMIQSQAGQSGVNILSTSRATTKTNDYFVEQLQAITVQTREDRLVDFLYNLGQGESMIRVRGLSLRPDSPRQQLGGNITLVASYQRKPMARPAAAAPARPPAAATKPTPAANVAPGKPPGPGKADTKPAVTKPPPRGPGPQGRPPGPATDSSAPAAKPTAPTAKKP